MSKLIEVQLFDIFESEKTATEEITRNKFYLSYEEKTLTDKEIDSMMNKIITSLENNLQAQIKSN